MRQRPAIALGGGAIQASRMSRKQAAISRVALGLVVASALAGAASAQTAPAEAPPGQATQPIMPSSIFSPSSTTGIDDSDDPFASGPVDQPFDAMGPSEAMPRIVLFDNADFTGRRMGLTEDDSDLHDRGFDAVASSVRIYGGTWELCDGTNFGGHCEQLSGNANLEANGFGDKVVSVRLVDR